MLIIICNHVSTSLKTDRNTETSLRRVKLYIDIEVVAGGGFIYFLYTHEIPLIAFVFIQLT